jgi:putative two-component system response regulator
LSHELEIQALELGVTDFLPKPMSRSQVRTRISNLLLIRTLNEELKVQNERLEIEIRKRTKDLQQAHLEALERLALAAEYRDYMTGRHTHRVGLLSARIASKLGLPDEEIDMIRRAAPLHDVGKIGIPDSILLKPGKLTHQEFEVMKTHVQLGLKLLSPNTSRLVQMAKLIALTHHERWDGTGYPNGLEGQDIPLVGQIVAIADVYDALVSKRPYKHAWKVSEAIDEIRHYSGTWFSPNVVDAFLNVAGYEDDSSQALQS